MAIQGFFTGDVKIRDLNGVLKAVNGIVEVATDAGTVTSVGLTVGSTGTDVNVANSPITSSGNITLNLPTASATNRGLLSSADWTTFNSKQAALSGTGFVKISGTTISYDNSTYYLASNPSAFIALTSLSATAPLSYSNTTGVFSISQATTSTDGYLSSTDWNTFNGKQAAGSYITALTGEATASGPGSATVTLSTSAVTGKLLTGLNLTGGGTIAATDSILQAFGKVQNQISGMVGGVTFQGTWDASTNTPTLTSSVGTKGYYYIVSVAGSTNLNGITDWKIGDWAIFNGTTWDKVDNTDAVSSVNGFTGAVSLTTSNIAEGTNLYYLDSRARLALSFTAGSGAYDNTTGVITIPTNTSQLTNGANFITLSSLSASLPLAYNSGTGAFSIQVANGSQNGYLSSTDWTTFNGKQAALNGTGFVKISGTTISYDNSTYLTTSAAASTYLPLVLSSSVYTVDINGQQFSIFGSAGGYTSGRIVVDPLFAAVGYQISGVFDGLKILTDGSALFSNSGTTRFMNAVRFDSTLTNGTYTYTLPAATGTLALTSDLTGGTVTSVAATITGDAIGITGSPVTTSGTLALAFAGTSSQYINGAGNLINFPTSLVTGTGTLYALTKWGFTSGNIINSNLSDSGSVIYNTNPTAGSFAVQFNGNTTTGLSYGLLINAGSNANDIALRIQNVSSTSEYFFVYGDGKVKINNIPNATTDTDTFLVSDGGFIKYRTGAELLSDIGGASASGYVPYTGATTNLDLGTHTLSAYDLIIDHTSGSGVAASITKGGNGEALTVVKSSGSGNAASITGGVTLLSELHLTTSLADTYIASASNWNEAYNLRHNAVTLGTANGLSLSTQVLSLALASGSTTGALSSTDWTTFNNKQSALTNPVTGTGTTNYLPKFTGTSTIGNSIMSDSGSTISVAGSLFIRSNNVLQLFNSDNTNGFQIYNSGATGSTNANLIFLSGAVGERMRLDSSGNLGLGVTPSAWATGFKAIQMTGGVALASHPTLPIAYLGANYLATDAGAKYIQTDGASRFLVNGYSGGFSWDIAPSGTAGNAISFTQAMTLDASGFLGIGTTAPSTKLDVVGTHRMQFRTDDSIAEIRCITPNGAAFEELGLNGLDLRFYTSSTERMRLNASGNLGLGVTPSAWNSGYKVMDVSAWGSIAGEFGTQGTISLVSNCFANSTGYNNWTYVNTAPATRYKQYNGEHQWFNAPSGTAGNAISFTQAMTLDASGNLGIGITNPSVKLNVGYTSDNRGIIQINSNAANRLAAVSFFGNNAESGYIGYEGGSEIVSGGQQGDLVIRNVLAGKDIILYTNGGSVGIGTTTPSQLLHLQTTLETSSGVGTAIQIESGGAGGDQAWIGVNKGSGNGLEFSVENRDIIFNTGATSPFGGSERMRITSDGQVLIGITSTFTSARLQIENITGATTALALKAQSTSGSTVAEFHNPNGQVGAINTSGTSTSYVTTSDYRLKTDYKDFSGIDLINKIKAYDYEWKADKSRSYGVIAHELQSVINYAVFGEKDGEQMQGVDYSKIVPVLIKAIQELNDKIK